MSTQPDLALWDEAVKLLYNGEPEQALDKLKLMKSHTSKTMFNMAVAYRLMERYDDAVKVLTKAIEMDPHLAIAYLERGILNIKLKRYNDALRDFELGQAKLLGHHFIDYSQLGMRARLHQDEFIEWQKHCKYLLEGADMGPNVKPLETSREIAFRPPKNKIANMHKMDYLGKPKVVTVLDKNDNFSGFSGLKKNVLSKSAPSSPISMKKLIIKAEVLDSPTSPGPKPTRPAPLPPQKDWKRLGDVTPMTPPPRRPVRLRKMPETGRSDMCFYKERNPLKSPKADATGSRELPASVHSEKSSSPLPSSAAAAAADLSKASTSVETFCLQLFFGSRHELQLSKDAPFSDLISAIKEICSSSDQQIMISKENGDFMALKTEQQLEDWWSSAPKTNSRPLTVFIINQ